jgi:PTS system maltose and glucose-specific IIC component
MLAGALASFTTGITEPLEFCFIFVSPVLYVMHAVLTGISFVLMQMFHVMIGNVQGGAIDFLIFGVLGGAKTHWWYPLILGIIYAPIYYFSFRWVILRMQVKTPGREDENDAEERAKPAQGNEKTRNIILGLGGEGNIAQVDCCFTRLRVKVKDMAQVQDDTLLKTGAMGVKRVTDNDVHVIYGPQVEQVANLVKAELSGIS